MKKDKKWSLQSLFVASGTEHDFSNVKSLSTPIFQTSNYMYDDVESGTQILVGEKPGYIYGRYSNPTVDVLNEVVAEIEGGEAALSFGSGLAAISAIFQAYCQPGDHIVASSLIYGATFFLLQEYFDKRGVEVTFVDPTNLDEVEKSVKKNTKLLYVEPQANPTIISADISAWAEIAHKGNALLVVDNTFTPPPIFTPLSFGADIVVHSATKYLGGHSDLLGGVIISSKEHIEEIRPILKYFGGIISPFVAWLLLRGIRTLGVRLERQCSNALEISRYLTDHPKINQVFYAGLENNPQYQLNQRQFNPFGAMLAFDVHGGFSEAKKVMESLKLIQFTVSLGDVASLISHPASTSHVYLTPEERASVGVTDGLLRLSVGIEDANDLIEDLKNALG
ncbi:MAG: methionine gamma-lyase [Calditrichia bacterium]